MRFVEIEETIINIDSIRCIKKTYGLNSYKYLCVIEFIDKNNNHLLVDESYYNKLKDLLHPIKLTNDKEYINVNDFPGDNMIEE